MDLLLYKVSVFDSLLGTRNDILRSNVKYMWMQVISLTSILVIVYANDFASMYSDFKIGVCVTATYACTTIRNVTIIQFVNVVALLKKKFKILKN